MRIGYAKLKGNTLFFDEIGWAIVKAQAKRSKKSPKKVVTAAILRYIRARDKNAESKKA